MNRITLLESLKNKSSIVFFREVKEYISKIKKHNEGREIYLMILSIYMDSEKLNLNAEENETLNDILDALTGYCAKSYWIGTADYHLISEDEE